MISEETIKDRIAELPDGDLKRFFERLDPETRRIVVSDESLLELSNEHLQMHFEHLMREAENAGKKELMTQFIKS